MMNKGTIARIGKDAISIGETGIRLTFGLSRLALNTTARVLDNVLQSAIEEHRNRKRWRHETKQIGNVTYNIWRK